MLSGVTGLVDRSATSIGILYDVTFCVHNYKEIVYTVKKLTPLRRFCCTDVA